jgi:exopolysaccharide biosynthesis protein
MKHQKVKKCMPLWKVVMIDLLVLGIILLTFALFHHVLPKVISQYRWKQIMQNATESAANRIPGIEGQEQETVTGAETASDTEPGSRTPWQIRFQEHFTDEVVVTDNSYTSQEISITIDTVAGTIGGRKVTYYVADIYIASLENFKTYTAYGDVIYYGMQDAIGMVRDTEAVLAVNGDFMTVQRTGFLVRNGEVFLSDQNNGVCVLYPDGTVETYDRAAYNIEDILAGNPQQVWSFGPALLDAQGKAIDSFELSSSIAGAHPRTALGYYEPGHYCFVVVDGRQSGYSAGVTITELAQIFEDLGCSVAYNLDGGQSSIMTFGESYYNRPYSNGRELGDILYIAESGMYTQTKTQEGTE